MQNLQLTIGGMVCAACQNHVTAALQRVEGVQDASVDLAAQSAIVRGENLDAASLISAVESEGYEAKIQIQ